MKDLIKKLKVAAQDADTLKELEKFGITADMIEEQKELETPATFEEFLELKDSEGDKFRSEFDRRLKKAQKTREDNLREKYELKEKEQKTEEKEEVKTDDPALKAILKELNDLKEKQRKAEEEKQKETEAQKLARYTENLTSKGIPAIYASKLDLDKDFDEQFETVKTEFEKDFGEIKPKGQKLPFPTKPDNNKPSKTEVGQFKKYI